LVVAGVWIADYEYWCGQRYSLRCCDVTVILKATCLWMTMSDDGLSLLSKVDSKLALSCCCCANTIYDLYHHLQSNKYHFQTSNISLNRDAKTRRAVKER
uniref:Secreted protein n=1 Tax=Anisakis simplex TaxID=6269 RepID=A0A0M3J3N8_ANISI